MSVTTYPPTPPLQQQPTNNVLGMIAILLGMLDAVGQIATAAFAGQAYAAAVKTAGGSDFEAAGSAIDPHVARIGICFLLWIVLWLVSLVPFILGIIAVRRTPRMMGVVAIIVSVLAPILAFVVFCSFVIPAVNQYPA